MSGTLVGSSMLKRREFSPEGRERSRPLSTQVRSAVVGKLPLYKSTREWGQRIAGQLQPGKHAGNIVDNDGSAVNQNTKVCHEHLDQPLFFFCETCSIAICRDCTVVAHDKTAGHSIVRIKDVVVVHRRALEDQLQESHAARAQIQKSTQLGSCIEKLQADKDYVIGNLKSMITFAREQLELCEQQVTDAIIQHHEAQHGAMLDKQCELYQTSSMLDKRINQSEELMKTGDIIDIINITEKLKAATGNAKADSNIFEVRNKWLASDLITGASPLNDKLCHLEKKCLETSLPTNFVLQNNKVTAGLKSTFTLEFVKILMTLRWL